MGSEASVSNGNPIDRDEYGNPTYTQYNREYVGQTSYERDEYGTPTYGETTDPGGE